MKVAIIGAGIVGATAAYHLAQKGVEVIIFDEGVGQATKAAAGIICPWLSQRRNQYWYQLVAKGAAYYPELMQQLRDDGERQLPYKQVGAFIFKKNAETLAKLLERVREKRQKDPMIGDLIRYPSAEVAQKIPGWAGQHDAIYCSGGGRVDGQSLVNQLLKQAQQKGAIFIPKKASLRQDSTHDIIVECNHQDYFFDQVILSSGAWVKELLTPLGYEVDVRPQKGQLIELELQVTEDTSQWPVCMLHGEMDIIPFENGKVIVGATHENDKGFDLTNDVVLQAKMHEEAAAIFPLLKEAKVVGTRVGTRAYTSDFLPFFGKISGLETLLVASGLGSSGLTSGVWIGKQLAEMTIGVSTDFERKVYSADQYIKKNTKTVS